MKKSQELCGSGHTIRLMAGKVTLEGKLTVPKQARGIIILPNAGGNVRCSVQNHTIAFEFQKQGLATLLINLLTIEEEVADLRGRTIRFNIDFLARRLMRATYWLKERTSDPSFNVHYFASDTSTAASLVAAAELSDTVGSVVSFAGRPDLAEWVLSRIGLPVLFIVGGKDFTLLDIHREVLSKMPAGAKLVTVPGSERRFEKPGELKGIARHALKWFNEHLERCVEPECVPGAIAGATEKELVGV